MNLKTGDLIFSKTAYLGITHVSIVYSKDPQTQSIIIAENQKGVNVRKISLSDWEQENEIIGNRPMNLSLVEQENVRMRIDNKIGKEYFVRTYNCEHFVSEVLFGNKESPQLQKIVFWGALSVIAYNFLFRKEKPKPQVKKISSRRRRIKKRA